LIDLPGHGKSDAPEWDYTVELFAHAVALVLKQEEIEKAVLVGHSLGGPVSTMLLRLFPDTVSAIIYVDSFFNLPDYYLTRSQRQELGERLSDDSKFEALIRTVIGTRATDEQRNEILKVMRNTPKHVRVNARTTNSQPAAMSVDQIYPIPALLLVTPRYADIDKDWIRHIPRLEVKLWEGHGHFPFLEDHVRFNHEVETFLQQHQLMQ
jgi:pimeloyl-ACP methyl ester carboxylesterase